MPGTKTNRGTDREQSQAGSNASSARLLILIKLAEILAREWPNANERRKMVTSDQSYCWVPFTEETSNRLGLYHMCYLVYRLLSTSYFRMLVYELRTNRRYWVVVNSYRHGTNELLMESSKTNYGRTNNKRLFNSVWQQTDRNAPMTSRVFIANNITAY